MTSPRLALSRYIRPAFFVGDQMLNPQNMTAGPERLAYLYGLISHLNFLLREGVEFSEVSAFLAQVPLGKTMVRLDESARSARLSEQAEDYVHLNPQRISISFADGRKRGRSSMLTLAVGEESPQFAHLLSLLGSAEGEGDSAERASMLVEHRELLEYLAGQEVVEPLVAKPSVTKTGQPPWVTWLGHACCTFETSNTAVWVDPFFLPQIAWREDEVAAFFSPKFADSVLVQPYGPDTEPFTPRDLLAPQAVLITHPDTDHFDLGTLMTLPEKVEIIVPRAHPGSEFDVGLDRVIDRFLGRRRVICLGHGESHQVGDITVRAFPFSGEVPAGVLHAWNCYLCSGAGASVAFCADSAIDELQTQFLVNELERSELPLYVFGRVRGGDTPWHGYRDSRTELYNEMRGWCWHTPVKSLFAPVPGVGVGPRGLSALSRSGVAGFFPYATGSTPWMRCDRDPHTAFVGSLSLEDWKSVLGRLQVASIRVPPLQYGQPYSLA
jgi:L-ascorbate metabolism protein UlaG (beta-lactamase superfamily)